MLDGRRNDLASASKSGLEVNKGRPMLVHQPSPMMRR